MKIHSTNEIWPWLPRHRSQSQMSTEEIQIDNYCREVLQTLNKVTPQNIDILVDKMGTLNIKEDFYIKKLVYYVVRKAASEVYAEMCRSLNQTLDNVTLGVTAEMPVGRNCTGLLRTLVLKECEEESEKIFEISNEINWMISTGISESDSIHFFRQRMFGIMIFIGQLYKIEFLSEEILTAYIDRLLHGDGNSIEFQIECLHKLLIVVGLQFDSQCEKKCLMDKYFIDLEKIHGDNEFCSRVRFSFMDLKDMRQNNWVARRVKETPTTIDEIRANVSSSVKTGLKVKKKKKKNRKNKEE